MYLTLTSLGDDLSNGFETMLLGLGYFWDWGAFGWEALFAELLFWGAFGGDLLGGAFFGELISQRRSKLSNAHKQLPLNI